MNNSFFKKIANSVIFRNIILIIIFINAFLIGVETSYSSQTITIVQNLILIIFIFEIIIRFSGANSVKDYFQNTWNIFDIVIVAIALIPENAFEGASVVSAFRVLRVFRVLRLIKAFPELSLILRVLFRSIKSIASTGFLFLIFMYLYAIVGVYLFRLPAGSFEGVDPYGSVGEGFFTLFRILTGEDWTDLRYNLLGHVTAYSDITVTTYHVTWMILSAFLLVNLVVGAVINNYELVMDEEKNNRLARKLEIREHTLILGWNIRIFDIIRELLLANESESNPKIVILSEHTKDFMDSAIAKNIPDSKNTEIITRSGNISILNELKRVNAPEAKSVILLSPESDSSPEKAQSIADIIITKTILAITEIPGRNKDQTIVAEIFSEDKKELINSLPYENIVTFDAWEILGKLLVQTSLSSGLSFVYSEILSFDGSEVYFYNEKWNGIEFGNIAYHLKDGIPLGVSHADGQIELRPHIDYIMKDNDDIIVLADDDSTIKYSKKPISSHKDLNLKKIPLVNQKRKQLILGWHQNAPIIINEYSTYLPEGSSIDIMLKNPNTIIQNLISDLNAKYHNLTINILDIDPMNIKQLRKADLFSYSNIIILQQDQEEISTEKVDSETLFILVSLRRIKDELNIKHSNTKIISQILNSDNQELIEQVRTDDFIISNKLVTMVIAQMSENSNIKKFYDDIFQADGSEIYLKPAENYFSDLPAKYHFSDIMHVCNFNDEICLGFRNSSESDNVKKNFGIQLNPDKNTLIELKSGDSLVVLAEDEL